MADIVKIKTTRDEQILLQAYFANVGSTVTLHNQETYLTERGLTALRGLIDKGVLTYERNDKQESMEVVKNGKQVDKGERFTREEDFDFLSKINNREYIPIRDQV
jgi:hypothetical protein